MREFLTGYAPNYQGARWRRSDLHLHSPGAFSFKFPAGVDPERDRDAIVDQYVRQLIDQGIEIAAITDYQGVRIEWFEPIQKAAAAHDIVIYPGAEVSFNFPKHGLHVLAIFPLNTDLEAINRSIHALDRDAATPMIGDEGKHRDITTETRVQNALRKLREDMDCLLILAHPNDNNGLFKSCSLKDAAEFIRDLAPDAIESFKDKDQERLVNNGGFKREAIQRIASIESSDPKSIGEIGTKTRNGQVRTTYLKLSAPTDLRALRLALHDPAILVTTGKKPSIDYTHFTHLQIDGSGFLDDLDLALSPELNVLVGGRGVGKSAILETIRYVLDLAPYEPTAYREGLVHYALGSGGKATLYAEQYVGDQVRRYYRFERVRDEDPLVYELNPERIVHLSPIEVLADGEQPIYFGQREIYEVTSNESQRLRLLDEIVGQQAQQQIREVEKLETKLRQNAREILEFRKRLLERGDIEQRLKEIRHQIELYRRYGIVEKLREASALANDEQRLQYVSTNIDASQQDWRDVRDTWRNRWEALIRRLDDAESSQKALLSEAAQIVRELRTEFDKLLEQGEALIIAAQAKVSDVHKRWDEERKPLDEEIRKAKQELGPQSLDPDELIRMTTEETALLPQLEAMKQVQNQIEVLEHDRISLLTQLREARRQVWKVRQAQAEDITKDLNDRVRVNVVYNGQHKEFVEALVNFFKGSGLDRRSIERMASSGSRVDGITIADKVREGAEALAAAFGLSPARAQKLASYLMEDEGRLFSLQLLAPDDAVEVALKLNDNYQLLEKLSAGQRATAMLLLLLAQEDRLLLVDQPEDDLDNRFIYEDVVQILREQKGRRQLLAATHNPNIPVLAHAELIVALEASESNATVIAEGAIDKHDIQKFVRDVMEGGEDAFQRRAEKYGWV